MDAPAEDELVDEIDVMAYLTPPAETGEEEVDPKAVLEALEREEDERRRDLSVCSPAEEPCAVGSGEDPEDESMGDCTDGDNENEPSSAQVESPVEGLTAGVDGLTVDVPRLEDGDRTFYGSDDVVSESTDEDTASPDSASSNYSSDSDTSSEELEVLWSGTAPWAEDDRASEADALLVHACSCDATRRCHDLHHSELCLPMKRLLRSACWASHNRRWLRSRGAALVACLLGYHSLHCDARRDSCVVPLCDALRGLRLY